MTEVQFFPAVMVGHFNKITKHINKGEYRFWGKDSLFQYNKLLYSFYYLKDRHDKLKDDESYFDSIGYNGIRMVDSGGFQIGSIGAKIEPEDVVKLYKREKVNIGMTLDIPMKKGYNKETIDINLKNMDKMVALKSEIPTTELLNVAHGTSLDERRRYYSFFEKYNNILDGWSIGLIKRLPPIFNAWSFLYLYEHDKTLKNKRLHFLGITGNKNIPMIYYLAKLNLVKNISFDSTKYGREGIMADMRNPAFMMERLSIGKMAKGKLSSNKFCPCPICLNIPFKRMVEDSNFVILHNLFWEIKKFDFFDSFASAEDLKNHINLDKKNISDGTRMAIKFIDYALSNGLEKAEKKFSFELKQINMPVTKSSIDYWV